MAPKHKLHRSAAFTDALADMIAFVAMRRSAAAQIEQLQPTPAPTGKENRRHA